MIGSEAMLPTHLIGLSQPELIEWVAAVGEQPYRARQIFSGMHARRLTSFDAMTELAKELRSSLKDRAVISTRSEEHTSELQSRFDLVCRLLLEKKKKTIDEQDV